MIYEKILTPRNYFLMLAALLVLSCTGIKHSHNANSTMFMGNSQHTGYSNSESIKTEPHILWKVKTDGPVVSSPILADGMIYVGSNDQHLYAIDASTGLVEWKYKTNGEICSTPLVTNGTVLFLSYDGFFYALDEVDGSLIWKFKTGGESKFLVKDYFNHSFQPDFWDFYLSSATADKNRVFFGSSDSTVYALNIQSGDLIWRYKAGASLHSSPAIADDLLIIGGWDGKIYALDASTGKEEWQYATGQDTAQYIWLGIQASPSIEKGAAYIGSRDAKFYALDMGRGDTIWTCNGFDMSWIPSSAAIGKENIYVGSSDAFRFYSINKETGKINYATKTNSYTFSSPAIDNEMAYIGSANGRLYGIGLDCGQIKWEFKTIGCTTDTLHAFDVEGKMDMEQIKPLMAGIKDMPALSMVYNNIFASSGAVFSSPLVSNQIIYFSSYDGYIYAITDKQ